jgi:hypothetical protein
LNKDAHSVGRSKASAQSSRPILGGLHYQYSTHRLPYGLGVDRLADLPALWSRQDQMLGLPYRHTRCANDIVERL